MISTVLKAESITFMEKTMKNAICKCSAFALLAVSILLSSCSKKEETQTVQEPETSVVASSESAAPKKPEAAAKKISTSNAVVLYDECGIYVEKNGKMVSAGLSYAGYRLDAVVQADGSMESKEAIRDYDGETRTFCRFIEDGESYWIQDAFVALADYPAIVNSKAVLYGEMDIGSMKSSAIEEGKVVAITLTDDPSFVEVAYYSNGLKTGYYIKSDRVSYDANDLFIEQYLLNKKIQEINKKMSKAEEKDNRDIIVAELNQILSNISYYTEGDVNDER